MKKKSLKKILSVLLATGIITSSFSIPTFAAETIDNSNQNENSNNSNQLVESNKSENSYSQYDMSIIDTAFLYSHTSKTSEVPNDGSIEKVSAVTSDDELYSELGIGDNLSEESKKLLESAVNTNPLAGYTFVNPEELLVGYINKGNQHKGYIQTKDNVDVTDISGIDNTFSNLVNSADDYYVEENKSYQTHNAIGFDCDGDGVDELAYLGLYDGGMEIVFYDREIDSNGNLSSTWTQKNNIAVSLSKDNEILDIIASESKGYTAMTAGDFDHDGVEELAFYAPAANNGFGEPLILVIKINCLSNGRWPLEIIGEIKLSSVSSDNDFADLKKGNGAYENWRMPVVALSTTSIRLGDADTSTASTKYETFDDLVINVSVPRVYTDDEVNMDSVVAIYSYENQSFTNVFNDSLNYGTYRMTSINSADADLNGDGFEELVVAGLKETGLKSGDSNSSGSLSTSKNLVQLITWNGSKYETVWTGKDGKEYPKEVEAAGNLDLGHFQSLEPIALSAGHYYTDDSVPSTQDQLCIQGVILSCTNAKVSGTALYSENNSSGEVSYCVLDTKPYCDIKNYNGCDVQFSKLYKYDITDSGGANAHHNPYLDTAVSGHFMTNSEVDAIVILSNDTDSANDDNINYDISIIAYDTESGKWKTKVYNDYLYHEDEDDKGTCLYTCFIDSDFDTMYYKYTGKYVTYSSPNLYSIVQAPPYYSENNASSTSISYSISHGVTSGDKVNWGVGGVIQTSAKIPLVGGALNISVSATAEYLGSYTWKHTETTTQTFNLKTNSDYAVVFALPIVVNTYSVWYPSANNGSGEWGEMQTTQSLEPVFAALTIDDYNTAVSKITDEDQKKCAPEITNLPKSTAGDPIAYYHDYEDVTNDNSDDKKFNDCKQDINSTFSSVSSKIDFTDATEHTEGFNTRIQIVFSFGADKDGAGASAGAGILADLGYTHIDASSDGTSFSATYGGIKTSNMDNVTFSDSGNAYSDYYLENDGKKEQVTSNITHYQPADYMYSAHAVAYTRSDIKNDGDEVYILSHYTDNYPSASPPEPVKYFGIQSVSKTSDNEFKITFAWDSKTRNEEREADGYNIYVKDAKSNNNQVNLVNTDGPIKKSTDSEITTYTATGFTDLNSGDYKFYIAPVYIDTPDKLTVNVREGIICKSLDIDDIELLIDDGNIIISNQPKNQYLNKDGEPQKITFSVDAYDTQTNDDSTLSFQWQRYSTSAQSWVNVQSTDENGIPFVETSKEHSSVYSFYGIEADVYVPIRCLVTLKRSSVNYIVYSTDSVTTMYGTDPTSITISPSTVDIYDGETAKLSLTFDPANSSNKSVTWTSSNENVVKVDQSGTVTGIKGGSAIITACLNSNPNIKASVNVIVNHHFNEDGFCDNCGEYLPATYNEKTGYYEIEKAGQLFWFAALVNGDSTHASLSVSDKTCKGMLTADIDLKNREWIPICNFNSIFDGQNHTVSNLSITQTSSDSGLFGSASGTIKNLIVKGNITLNSNGSNIGGIVGYANGATISNVQSYVNISNGNCELKHVGGIVGTIDTKTTIVEKCINYGTINISDSTDCISGIAAYTNSGGKISNCANLGTVSTTESNAYTGGILGYVNNSNASVKNCYNYGKVSNKGSTSRCGAIIGWARGYSSDKITNNYYLDTSSSLAFGSDSKSGVSATAKNTDEFKSGKVAYLLNNTVTDGSQVWYQNIDNGQTPDDYPVLDNTHGTVYYITFENIYSNTYHESEPDFDTDEDGRFIIRTYDDLVTLAENVKNNYDTYGSANYVLENNIIAPDNSVWTMGIGSIDKPFNGTFNSNDHYIVNVTIDSEYAGIFGVIGEKGIVENLILFGSEYTDNCSVSGGIAAVNNGIIDHCQSGINLSTGYIYPKDGSAPIKTSELNSIVIGEISGGIAGENNGTIIGSRNASIVRGSKTSGGIAGVNNGKIYGSANSGTIGVSTSEVSGGIAGENNGELASSYSVGNVKGSTIGMVIGINNSDNVKNVYGKTNTKVSLTGTGVQLDDTNKSLGIASMSTDEFTNTLNEVTDNTVIWARYDGYNMGYPIIASNVLLKTVQHTGNIYVEGLMHSDLKIIYTDCKNGDSLYNTLKDSSNGAKILSAYTLNLSDKDGNDVVQELWCQGEIKISVPAEHKNVSLIGITSDGEIVTYSPVSFENGMAVFTVSELMSFAIAENICNNDSSSNVQQNNTVIPTGDSNMLCISLIALMLILAFAVIILMKRRNDFE